MRNKYQVIKWLLLLNTKLTRSELLPGWISLTCAETYTCYWWHQKTVEVGSLNFTYGTLQPQNMAVHNATSSLLCHKHDVINCISINYIQEFCVQFYVHILPTFMIYENYQPLHKNATRIHMYHTEETVQYVRLA